MLKKGLKRLNFLSRKKASSPPEVEESDVRAAVETSTSKYSRRPVKKRKEIQERAKEAAAAGKPDTRQPSLNTGTTPRTARPTRNFVRRRQGGANATVTTTTTPLPVPVSSRRPTRVASRRRPLPTTVARSATTTARATTTTEEYTTIASEETLDDDTDFIEDPSLQERPVSKPKGAKPQRRPLVLQHDQNPEATNEGERQKQKALEGERKSKKYSASIKQNQLDEVLKRAKSSEEVDVTTENSFSTSYDFTPETAVAIAAHNLIIAPLPTTLDYNEPHTTKRIKPTQNRHTNKETTTEDYPTTPYRTTVSRHTPKTSTQIPLTTRFISKVSKPSGFTFKNQLKTTPIPVNIHNVARGETSISPAYSRVSQSPSFGPGIDLTTILRPSTARYLGSNGKPIPVPVEDYSLSPGYSSVGEPSFHTREYLLESPVTKTYDDEYQYLSPVTPAYTTTRKLPKKTIYKKISTTIPPTPYPVTSPKPRRVATRQPSKPFEKVPKTEIVGKIKHTYRPIENYDYYDEGDVKIGNKYEEGTKVVLHGKGTIECLDMGNFPHPSSCKKFISCARIDNGSILGWEYICPKGLSFDPVGGICNWSAGLGCDEKDA